MDKKSQIMEDWHFNPVSGGKWKAFRAMMSPYTNSVIPVLFINACIGMFVCLSDVYGKLSRFISGHDVCWRLGTWDVHGFDSWALIQYKDVIFPV